MFKRRTVTEEKRKPCAHEYVLADYKSFMDSTFDIVEYYEIICDKCEYTRSIEPYEFTVMKRIGLIKGTE